MLIDGSNVAAFLALPGGAQRVSPAEALAHGTQINKLLSAISARAVTTDPFALPIEHPEYYAAYPRMKEQGFTGFCEGMQTAGALQYHFLRQYGVPMQFSGSYIQWRYRAQSGQTDVDIGATNGGILAMAQMFGVCIDPLFPDDLCQQNEYVAPPAAADADAPLHRLAEFIYVGEGSDLGMRERLIMLIAAGAVIHLGLGNHATFHFEAFDWGIRGANSKGGPDVNHDGKVGISWDILPQCWNLYASFGIDLRNPAPSDALAIAESIHALATERFFALTTTVQGWAQNMPTLPPDQQINAIVQQLQGIGSLLSTVGSMISGLASSPPQDGDPKPTSTSLTVMPNPVSLNGTASLKATVSGVNPSGNVSFAEGTIPFGDGEVVGGVATYALAVSRLGLGSHSIKASYAGDNMNVASSSLVVTLVVQAAAPPGTSSDGFRVPRDGPELTDKDGSKWTIVNSLARKNGAAISGYPLQISQIGIAAGVPKFGNSFNNWYLAPDSTGGWPTTTAPQ